ncbi:MAG: YcgN family cysteine cluster protein [Pseudomonadota bacterium]
MRSRFWEGVPLDRMSRAEWEALCDGCGRCCAVKLEDEDTGRVHYTNVTCRLFDNATCRCGNYALRRQLVKGCVLLTPEGLEEAAEWLPRSCAYRRLYEGRALAAWHPLVSGDPDSVRRAGMSLHDRGIPEYEVEERDLEDHIVEEDF